MATITKPMALDESFNTTESTSRNQADVLAAIESAIRQGFGRSAADVSYDNTGSELTADDVQEAIDELAAEKVDKVEGKGLSTNDFTDEDKAALDNMELDIAGTQTASGNPLTLTDAAPINAESLVVELEPKQDLHGQSAPYVGGSGKNLVDYAAFSESSIVSVALDKVYDDAGNCIGIKFNGTSTSDAYLRLNADVSGLPEVQGKLNFSIDGASFPGEVGVDTTDSTYPPAATAPNTDVTITDLSKVIRLWVHLYTGRTFDNVILKPMIRLSTETDPTFAPYSNICPITGYTECEVDDVGKNKLPMTVDGIKAANTGGTWSGNVYTINNGTFTILADDGGNVTGIVVNGTFNGDVGFTINPNTNYLSSNDTMILNGCPAGGNFETSYSLVLYSTSSGHGYPMSDTDTGNGAQNTEPFTNGAVAIKIVSGYTASNLIFYPMIRLSTETDPTFEPYHTSNATIQFGQTVYGGEVDFIDGGTDDDRVKIDLGSLTWNKQWTDGGVKWRFYSSETISNIVVPVTADETVGAISSAFREVTLNQSWYGVDGICVNVDGSIFVCCNGVNNVTDFANLVTNETCVLYRTTPTQLSTPPTDLKLLKGTNHITTNGTTINLGYQPDNVIGDVKGEIEKCAVDAEFMQFTDGTDTFTDVNLSLDASFHTVSVVGSKIEQKRFICFEVAEIRSGSVQGIHASCIAFTDGAKTPSGTAFRAYIESLQMYVNFRIYGSGGSYTLAYQSETSFSASAFFVRLRMMNNL